MIHHHHHHKPKGATLLATLAPRAAVVLFSLVLGYVLLEKKLLPRSWWAPLSKLYFYPMLLPMYLVRSVRSGGRSYFSDVDQFLMIGPTPLVIAGHVSWLHRDGVRAVVNMQAEYGGPTAAYAALRPPIAQLHLPVVDHTEPSARLLEQAVAFIARHRSKGHRVLVHCKGGHGRSAAVAMAWLMSEGGGSLTPEDAQRRLSSVRDVRSQLFQQEDVVAFYRSRQSTVE